LILLWRRCVGIAACCLSVLMALPFEAVKPRNPPTWKIAGLTILTGILAMGIGMTLLLFALSGGKTGIVATISATSPVLILPMLWLRTGERPAAGAWAGAALAVAGMAMLFLNR
jgi:drug/metabolite transporter (DMT)-like permease